MDLMFCAEDAFSLDTVLILLKELNEFCLHLYISHVSTDDGLSGPKHVVSGIIKAFVCVMATLPF
jgi:hypothetical protein